ncbi:MAG TPA: hypothetical protein VM737_11140, partial [Gemmatimonadota bacterium]|nr:hypothetical protein [Gemmatimonadota bacterium]
MADERQRDDTETGGERAGRREEPTPAAEESLGMGEAGVDLSSIPDTIPLLPLRDAVLFPNAVVPL